jgi:Type VII secretion system ESX-1, transport TM domain B
VVPQSKITQAMLAPASPGLSWPADLPKFSAAEQTPNQVLCLAFSGSYDPEGEPQLAVSTSTALPHPLTASEESEPAPSGRHLADVVSIAVGHGVVAHDHDTGTGEASVTYLITDSRMRFTLVGGTGATASSGVTAVGQLGYADVPASDVPGAWLALLPEGPALDPAKASQSQPG